jgi:hypothetical protein
MSIQPKNSWLYQGLALLLWLACMKSAWSSSLSDFPKERPKITPYLIGTEQLLAQSAETTAPSSEQDPPRSRYRRVHRQIRAQQAIGTATLGSLAITKAFGADPYQNNWLSPLACTMTFASAIGTFYVLQQPSKRRNRSSRDIYLPSVPQTTLSASIEDSDRKSIQANAEIYWNKKLYKGRAIKIGSQSIRVELDEGIRGLKTLMPIGLIISQESSQEATEIPQRFLVQVVSIEPLGTKGKHRFVLELRFPQRWKKQNQKVKVLINVLH